MPFIQSCPGGRLTDWRSSCKRNSDAKIDHQLKTDGEYRQYLQTNAVQARDMQRSHVVVQPYFESTGCPIVWNPRVDQYGRPK